MNTEKIRKAASALLEDAVKHNSGNPRLVRLLVNAVKGMPVVRKVKLPLSVKRVKQMQDANGMISVVVPLEMSELMTGEECLNDVVSEWILRDSSGLEGIEFEPVGIENGMVLVRVTADVTNWLEKQEPEED